MKRVIYIYMVLMLLGVGSASGQHYFGVRAGIGNGSSRFFPMREMGSVWGLKSGGVAWKHYTDEQFTGGIEMDAMWMQQGYREYEMIPSRENPDIRERGGYYQRTVDVVMVPFMWQPHLYMFRQRLRIFLNAGITFSHILSSEERTVNYAAGIDQRGKYNLISIRDNRFGYGLVGGGGISWAFGRLEIFGEARYYVGYSDVLKNRNKYSDPYQPLRSPLDGLQFQAGVFYRIGKGGIKSTQGNGERRRKAVVPDPEFTDDPILNLPPEPRVVPDAQVIPPMD
jgi:hypothetical protein